MPLVESSAELDIQVRAHVLANLESYEQAGRYLDTVFSPESVWYDDLHTVASDIASNSEWREYVSKAFAVMRQATNRKPTPVDRAMGAAKAFIESLGTLAWHARQLTDPRRIEPGADDPNEWKSLGA